MIRLRGGSGLGDSIYLRPIVDHLERTGAAVTVLSNYSDLFIGTKAIVEPFSRKPVNVLAHYSVFRSRQSTNQFEDVCEAARLERLSLRFDWKIRNRKLISDIRAKAAGRKVILVHGGRAPFGRTDGLGMEIMPKREAFDTALFALSDCYTVRIGKGQHYYDLSTEHDLTDITTVSDMIDLACSCDGVVTQCGFPIPLAECFDKPVLVIFGAAGLASRHPIIKLVTPAKILCKPSSSHVVDDWTDTRIAEEASAAVGLQCEAA